MKKKSFEYICGYSHTIETCVANSRKCERATSSSPWSRTYGLVVVEAFLLNIIQKGLKFSLAHSTTTSWQNSYTKSRQSLKKKKVITNKTEKKRKDPERKL